MAEPEQNRSVGWVALMLALVVLYFGWAALAADYFQHDLEGPSRINIWLNSIYQLPKIVSVIGYGFSERSWIIWATVGGEAVVFVLFLFMRKMERELWKK